MSLVIKAENISKQYKLGSVGMSNLQDDVKRLFARLQGKEDPFLKIGETNSRDQSVKGGDSQYVWALKDINFEINKGEVVGIIGKNGAGKSTLLKILSRVTEPTTGQLKYKGRLATLLEVGTGFHPDLSGRDNIYLNGAILGMRRDEISRKFDEIVEFSGVAKYIDTPVKRYSSGMYVRLAFAVAAHLEPDILVIDEVLAVGDQEFQDKCIGKMKDVAGDGRTVLFVSHNMSAIKSLCKRSIVLQQGTVIFDGSVQDGIQRYLSAFNSAGGTGEIEPHHRTHNTGKAFYRNIVVKNEEFSLGNKIYFGKPINISCRVEFKEKLHNIVFDVRVISSDGIEVAHTMNAYTEGFFNVGGLDVNYEISMENNFQPGRYYLTFGIHLNDGSTLEFVENVIELEILSFSSDDSAGSVFDFKLGYIRPKTIWKIY